jgi:molybdenum cofactor cytidylyltransferase
MIAAVVPAAGLSVRMGRPKLTLPVDGGTVIASVVQALLEGGVDTVVVVVSPRGQPGQAELIRSIRDLAVLPARIDESSRVAGAETSTPRNLRNAEDRGVPPQPPSFGLTDYLQIDDTPGPGVHIVEPDEPPPDMRSSVEIGLRFFSELGETPEAVLLAPGDLVGATARLIADVIVAARANAGRIVVPVVLGKRGHPVALPWTLALEIRNLPPDVGVNVLLKQNPANVVECVVEEPGALVDLDTPEDYETWRLKQIP